MSTTAATVSAAAAVCPVSGSSRHLALGTWRLGTSGLGSLVFGTWPLGVGGVAVLGVASWVVRWGAVVFLQLLGL